MREGIGFGLIAGVIFGLVEMAAAAMMGNPPLMPVQMFASIVLGQAALESMVASTYLVGVLAHLVLSAVFGLAYGIINAQFSVRARTGLWAQSAIGLLFGIALWFVNFHVIARALYPWFLMTPQLLQAMMHALFFGVPLGLMYAAAQRRAHGVVPARA